VRQLRQAVRDNNLERALICIEDGAPVDTVLENGETLLTMCASRGEMEFCGMAIISGANVNWRNDFGRTALFKAASAGHADIVELLLANAADPFVRDHHHPSSAAAAEEDNDGGRTALDWAGIARQPKCRDILMRAMVSFVRDHRFEAAEVQLIDEMKLIVQANEDLVNQMDVVLKTMQSVSVGLLVAEAPVTRERWLRAREHLRGCGALQPDVADAMLFFVDHETDAGVTALTKCAMSGDAATLERVIQYGAAVNHVVSMGHTALTWAATGGHLECVQILLHYGAQAELTIHRGGTGARQKTALIYAAMNDRPRVVQCLLDAHFEESLRFRLRTIAAAESARTLVERDQLLSADWVRFYRGVLEHRDGEGRNAMEWAALLGYRNVISFLGNAQQRIEERQRLLDNENHHAELVKCSLGCGFFDRRDSIARHELVFCVRRLVPCPRGCDARIPEEDIPVHLDTICSKRKVRCVNVYAGCYQLLNLGERETHGTHL
jgi:ankyrin repeat protein